MKLALILEWVHWKLGESIYQLSIGFLIFLWEIILNFYEINTDSKTFPLKIKSKSS